jgi:hypothetical protein
MNLDRRLGPWAYYWPVYYSNSYAVPERTSDDDEPITPLPKQWIGKILIRSGQKPAEIISSGTMTPTEANKYVFEEKINKPYIIIGPSETTSDYIARRLTIYVTADNVIENVRFG